MELYYVKGIKFVEYNEEVQIMIVVYKLKIILFDQICKEIVKLGFDVDSILVDFVGYEKCDGCCKL